MLETVIYLCYNKAMIKLIKTDTNHNVFNILTNCIEKSVNNIDGKNLIFCEEKISLMIERLICARFKGSINTSVYSFGNYLRMHQPLENVLSKEGSAMVVKRVLENAPLTCFRSSKTTLAPSLFELISQLKSAKVSCEDILFASQKVNGVLKNKLADIGLVYSLYQEYLYQNQLEDQSSMLSYLPSLVENSQEIADADVYLVGYTSITSQARTVMKSLLSKAKSVTAILVEGQNDFAYVNETCEIFKKICQEEKISLIEESIPSIALPESNLILKNIFNPLNKTQKFQTERVYASAYKNTYEEVYAIAESIKGAVQKGEIRYKDASVALSDNSLYSEHIKSVFDLLEIPYFIDEKKKPSHHPLILLILNYIDIFRKGFERDLLCSFIKNPLVCQDKTFGDNFEKYLRKYNLFYGNFKQPFDMPAKTPSMQEEFECFRKKILLLFSSFSVEKLLSDLLVESRLAEFTNRLKELNAPEESAVNDQIFGAVQNILAEIKKILAGVSLSYTEYRNVFLSGVTALELSIIPQYNDAVFIGGFKEISLYPSKYLFIPGLTSEVPSVKEDVALLADSDIDALEKVKIMIEPKIRIVNHRVKEALALATACFTQKLFVTYPLTAKGGDKTVKGEVYSFITQTFTTKDFESQDGYYTAKQGELTFAKACSDFYEGLTTEVGEPASYYYLFKDRQNLEKLTKECKQDIKISLERNKHIVVKDVTSPTTIENYYWCPYKNFLSHALKITQPDELDKVDHLSYGNLMHAIFAEYVKRIDEVSDKISSDTLFEQVKNQIFEQDQRGYYKRFYKDQAYSFAIERVLQEGKSYCYKTYLATKNSQFKTQKINVEVPFGKTVNGKEVYPAIPLLNGKVKLSGVIDRVDTFGDYCRVVDYKTGSTDVSGEKLYAGLKLQLYLYANAVNDKKVAGMYYLPISDTFVEEEKKNKPLAVGKTLDEKEIVIGQDASLKDSDQGQFLPVSIDKKGEYKGLSSQDNLGAMLNYSLKVSEKAVKQMLEGVIVKAPYEHSCSSCPYKAICGREEENGRKVKNLSEDGFYDVVKGDE